MRSNNTLSIFNSINVPPSSSLEKEVLSNHQQSVAANIHKFPLIRRADPPG
jgi:hypothetical protein